jgi:hypothetical protein
VQSIRVQQQNDIAKDISKHYNNSSNQSFTISVCIAIKRQRELGFKVS